MADLFAILLLLGAGAAAVFFSRAEKGSPQRGRVFLPFSDLADRLALPAPMPGATELSGNVAGFHVRVDGTPEAVFISLDGRGHIPGWLTVGPVAGLASENESDAARLATRDRFFDELFVVKGPQLETAAILSGRARALLTTLLGARVQDGVIIWRTTASYGRSLELSVQRVLELAKALSWTPKSALQRVATNAIEDPNPFVRLYNLQMLVQQHRKEPQTEDALVGALEDTVPKNAYFAARTIGGELGREYMKRFVLIGERDADRIAAYEELLEHEGWATVQPLLETGALGTSRAVARRAVTWLSERGGEDSLVTLLRRANISTPHVDLIIQAAAAKSGPAIEKNLLHILVTPAFAEAGPAHLAAVRALEQIGSPAALATLRDVAVASTGSALPVRKAARRAIVAIEARRNALGGTLALVEPNDAGGAVSFTAPTGALSVPPEDE